MPRAPPNSAPVSSEGGGGAGAFGRGRAHRQVRHLGEDHDDPGGQDPAGDEDEPHRVGAGEGEQAVAGRADREARRHDVGAVDALWTRGWPRAGHADRDRGSSAHSAASSALLPSTDCRYWVVKNAEPSMPNAETRFRTSAARRTRAAEQGGGDHRVGRRALAVDEEGAKSRPRVTETTYSVGRPWTGSPSVRRSRGARRPWTAGRWASRSGPGRGRATRAAGPGRGPAAGPSRAG